MVLKWEFIFKNEGGEVASTSVVCFSSKTSQLVGIVVVHLVVSTPEFDFLVKSDQKTQKVGI